MYATLNATGAITDPTGRRQAELRGMVVPNWESIDELLAKSVGQAAKVRGQSHSIALRGPLSGASLAKVVNGLDAVLTVDQLEATAFGLRAAPTKLVFRARDGNLIVDPIETTINGGRTLLRPRLTIDEKHHVTLHLASGDSIEGLELNDELSRRILSYVVPVWDEKTRARGKISVRVARAEIPLLSQDAPKRATAAGHIDFDEVVSTAGGLASELYAMTGQRVKPIRLHESIELMVANGRVAQRGLSVPLGGEARVEIDGSVGFDQTLALRARLVTDRQLAGDGQVVLNEVFEALKVGVPIAGTLSRPAVDRKAVRIGLRDLGKSLLKHSGSRNAAELLEQLVRPENDAMPKRR
jgi:translocation and assembly module TamB